MSGCRSPETAANSAASAELIVGSLWGAAAGLAVAGQAWALIPLALAVLITLVLRRSEATVMRRLAEATAT